MGKIRFKKLRLWMAYPVFIVFPFVADITNSSFVTGLIFMLSGLGLRFWASGYISKSSSLATSGPYAYTRNPLYLGNFILGLGVVIISNNIWLIAYYVVSFSLLYLGTIAEEQKDLRGKFGSAYTDYLSAVPVFLPFRRAYKKSAGRKFDINLSFKNGEFIRICGFSLLIIFFYLWRSFANNEEDFPWSNEAALLLFLAFFILLWFNIIIRRRKERR